MTSAGMGVESTMACYGVCIHVRAPDTESLASLLSRLAPERDPVPATAIHRAYRVDREDDAHTLSVGGRPVARGSLDRVAMAFAGDVDLFIAEMAPHHVFVHAGAVAWRGRAIVIPGRSFSGKTTLVAELVRAGATYYSDEYAVLDERGRVHPYARALSIREDHAHRRRLCTADSLGGRRGIDAVPVGLVVVTAYRRCGAWQPQALSAGRGVLALLGHTVCVRRRPLAALAALKATVARGLVLEGPRGEASPMIRSLFGTVAPDGDATKNALPVTGSSA
jgi:hypothetical protein